VQRHYSNELETFIGFCSKFIQETIYQISSQSLEFSRTYYKNTLVFFFVHTDVAVSIQNYSALTTQLGRRANLRQRFTHNTTKHNNTRLLYYRFKQTVGADFRASRNRPSLPRRCGSRSPLSSRHKHGVNVVWSQYNEDSVNTESHLSR